MAATASDMQALSLSAAVSTLVHVLATLPVFIDRWSQPSAPEEKAAREARANLSFSESMAAALAVLWASFALVTLQALGGARAPASSGSASASGQAECLALMSLFCGFSSSHALWALSPARGGGGGAQTGRTISLTMCAVSALGAACLCVSSAWRTNFGALFA